MGGMGSGRPRGYKTTTGDCRTIDIRYFKKQGLLEPGTRGGLTWSRNGTHFGSLSFFFDGKTLELSFSYLDRLKGDNWQDVERSVSLSTTPCNYGGGRYWLHCRSCHRRCAVLYMAGTEFHCRQCLGLSYQTQLEDRHGRACAKRNKLHDRLYGDNSPRMWNRTRERLERQYIETEQKALAALAAKCDELYGGDWLE